MSLEAICIPSSVESLGLFCFQLCYHLCFVLFEPDSRLSGLPESVFHSCGSLRWIRIPAGVRTMTSETFAYWHPELIEIDPANSTFGICENLLVNYEEDLVLRYFADEREIVIGNRFLGIAEGCFRFVWNLSRVQFEASSRICFFGARAFLSCFDLESFSIPSTVEAILEDCFRGCGKLWQVTFEGGSQVSVLGDRAFSGCASLAAFWIPSSVARIGTECFFHCQSLAVVTAESGIRIADSGLLV
jgi:hypothetical protein